MRHLKNFKFITGFVLFGSLFSSGIQAYDESEIRQTFEKINLNISDLHEMFVGSEKQLHDNDIALSDGIKNLKENQENQTKSIENILKEILKNQNSAETKLLSIEQKKVEELNALNTKLSTKLQMDSQTETLEKVLLKMQEILQQITAIKSEQTAMKEDLTTLKSVQNGVAVKVQELSGIKTDVSFLKAGQTNLTNKVEEIIKEQNETFTLSRENKSEASEEFSLLSLSRDCTPKQSSGPYFINIAQKEVKVFCQMDSDGGPWTVIQKRVGPSKANEPRQDFFLNWKEYEEGFGDVNEEYWIGLRNIAALTAAGESELRIEMTDWENNTAYAAYSLFKVGDSSTGYQLNIGNYSGTAGDSLAYHNTAKFSTKDKDQDIHSWNCAEYFKGAWWYNGCISSNLNGLHSSFDSNGTAEDEDGIIWFRWKGLSYSLKKVTMMTRRKL